VVHIQDLWPETVTASGFLADGKQGGVERVLHRFCDSVYRHAAAIAVTSPGMAERIIARGVPERKIAVVPNWADERYFHPAVPTEATIDALGSRFPFTVMYAGAMGEVQALETLVDAAVILRGHADIGFVLVGGGVAEDSLRDRSKRAGLTNVRFVARQAVDHMADVLALGDVQVISLRDLPVFRATLPSKVQATLAAGRPIICAVDGDAARVVRESGGGIVTAPESATDMAAAILQVARMSLNERAEMGDRGRAYYQRALSEDHGAQVLDELLHHAAEGRGRV
jgi:glycosyltransferase involved in cell wall biosynthesis